MIGQVQPVLIEKPGRKPGQMVGKSPYLHAVHLLADPSSVGRIIQTRITASGPNSLSAEAI